MHCSIHPAVEILVWPGADDAVAYLHNSGNLHLLSATARRVLERLQVGRATGQQLCDTLQLDSREQQRELLEHHLPYLKSLGLVQECPE